MTPSFPTLARKPVKLAEMNAVIRALRRIFNPRLSWEVRQEKYSRWIQRHPRLYAVAHLMPKNVTAIISGVWVPEAKEFRDKSRAH
jgi:hypothetical protein